MAGKLNRTFLRMAALFVLCFAVAAFQPASASPSYASPHVSGHDTQSAVDSARFDDRGHCYSDCETAGGETHSPNQSHEMPSQAHVFHFVVATALHVRPSITPDNMNRGSLLKIKRPPRP
jgi:hypothetical protein